MSVKIMSMVWERAPYAEGSLLVLLALADWSDDNGLSWPSIPKLALKARLKRRQVQRILRGLERDGILEVEGGRGRGNQNRYLLKLELLKGDIMTPIDEIKGVIGDIEKASFGTQKASLATQKASSRPPDPLEDPLEDPPRDPPEPVPPFQGERFTLALSDFFQNRKERKLKAYTPTGLRTLYRNLGEWGEQGATTALEDSVRSNWQGVFRPRSIDTPQPSNGNGHKPEVELDSFGIEFVRKPYTVEDAIARTPEKNPDDIRAHWDGQLAWEDVRCL